jgi:hypothetical protein
VGSRYWLPPRAKKSKKYRLASHSERSARKYECNLLQNDKILYFIKKLKIQLLLILNYYNLICYYLKLFNLKQYNFIFNIV